VRIASRVMYANGDDRTKLVRKFSGNTTIGELADTAGRGGSGFNAAD
jgi:hypothetical protein